MDDLDKIAGIYENISNTTKFIVIAILLLLILTSLIRVWIRLGFGLLYRNIFIISPSTHYSAIEDMIAGSGLFSFRNIRYIPPDDLDTPEHAKKRLHKKSLLVFYYDAPSEPRTDEQRRTEPAEYSTERGKQCELLKLVRENKESRAGLVVYARTTIPYKHYTDTGDVMNTVVVQAKGRFLNDLLNLMMTTSLSRWNLVSAIRKNFD